MSAEKLSNADRLRIAIALVAVKYKPSDQTFSSYVLDLRARFQPSSLSPPTADGSWRTYALSLERDYGELQIRYDAEKIKALALASSASSVQLPIANTVLEQSNASTTVKKKAKKKTSATVSTSPIKKRTYFDRTDPKSVLEGLRDRMFISTFPEPESLFSALNDVLLLTSLSDVEPTLLLSVVLRTVEAIAKILDRIVVRQAAKLSTDIDILETLSILVHHVLHGVLPLLVSFSQHLTRQPASSICDLQEPIMVLLERLTTLIFNRLIRAFGPLSETYLNALFLPPAASATTNTITLTDTRRKPSIHQSFPVDIRAAVLSLFQNIFSLIDGQLHVLNDIPKLVVVVHTLRASLILETIRELDHLLIPVPAKSPDSGNEVHTAVEPRLREGPETMERVKKLVTKDTFWYLCTILHILLSESSESAASKSVAARLNHGHVGIVRTQGGAEQLLNEGISDALLKLITTCRKRVSSCCHGYFRAENGIHSSLEVDRDREEDAEDSHVQGSDTYQRGKHKAQLLNEMDLGERIHEQEALHTIDTNEAAMDGYVSASGRVVKDSEGCCDDMVDLDEVSHEMLLGVIERYWVWSTS